MCALKGNYILDSLDNGTGVNYIQGVEDWCAAYEVELRKGEPR